MKKLLYIILFGFFTSCVVKLPTVKMGMSIDEFLQSDYQYCQVQLVEMSTNRTIYKSGYTNGFIKYFYYFNKDGYLYQVDGGVDKPDVKIKIEK